MSPPSVASEGVPPTGILGRRARARGAGMLALTSLLLVGAVGAGLCGCVTSSEGDLMHHDIAELKTRLDAIDKRDAEYKAQVVRLKKVLDDATALLARNSADVGAKTGLVAILLRTECRCRLGRLEAESRLSPPQFPIRR